MQVMPNLRKSLVLKPNELLSAGIIIGISQAATSR